MPVITTAGENLIAAQQAAGQNLVVDQIIFANITGLDHTAPVSKAEGKPIAGNIVATESITQAGLVNESTVVYSITMPSTMGTYSFNWMGLYSSVHDTVIAIAYTPVQEKRATIGEVLGNVLNKNFAVEFISASETTGITINAESWQIDYTARLETMDEIQRQAIKNIYGNGAFVNDAFKCEFDGTNYVLKSGVACLGGLFQELISDTIIEPGTLSKTVWVDSYQQKTMAGVINFFDVVVNDSTVLADYVQAGVSHSLVKVATVNSQVDIFDDRLNVLADFEVYHKGNLDLDSKLDVQAFSDSQKYQELDFSNAGGYFTSGKAVVARTGRIVTISCTEQVMHGTISSLQTVTNFLPDWAKPFNDIYGCYDFNHNIIRGISVNENGMINFTCRDMLDGTDYPISFQGFFTFTYVV
jgi:hypothetical protein